MSLTYGSLGVAAIALAWLYLLGRAVVAGAVLNVTLWERHTGRGARNGIGAVRDDGGGTHPRTEDEP